MVKVTNDNTARRMAGHVKKKTKYDHGSWIEEFKEAIKNRNLLSQPGKLNPFPHNDTF